MFQALVLFGLKAHTKVKFLPFLFTLIARVWFVVFIVFCLYHCIANTALLRITDTNTYFNYFVG